MDLIEVLLQWFAKMFDKTSAGANTPGGAIKIEIMPNQQLAEWLSKPIITKFEKQKVHSSFKDKIWDALICNL